MSGRKAQLRHRYREAFKKGEDVWYCSRFKGKEPNDWVKVNKDHVWKESKYWYAFTDERWITNEEEMAEFLKTHIILPSGRVVKR